MDAAFAPFVRNLERLVSPLQREELDAISGACSRIARFVAKQDLVREGDKPGDSNVLLEGMVCRYRVTQGGKRQILSFQVPGDMFDAQSFILHRMDHSIGTLTTGKLAVFPHAELLRITEAFPRLGRCIWRGTLIDAAIHREWMVRIGRLDAQSRIAHLMCEIYTRLASVGGLAGHAIPWPMTQTEIGDALGLSYVHINRCLQNLRSSGLISLDRSTLEIHDLAALKEIAEFEPDYLHLHAGEE